MTETTNSTDPVCPECRDAGIVWVGPHKLRDGRVIEGIFCEWCPVGDALREINGEGEHGVYRLADWLSDTADAIHAKQRKGEPAQLELDAWWEAYNFQQGKKLLH